MKRAAYFSAVFRYGCYLRVKILSLAHSALLLFFSLLLSYLPVYVHVVCWCVHACMCKYERVLSMNPELDILARLTNQQVPRDTHLYPPPRQQGCTCRQPHPVLTWVPGILNSDPHAERAFIHCALICQPLLYFLLTFVLGIFIMKR